MWQRQIHFARLFTACIRNAAGCGSWMITKS